MRTPAASSGARLAADVAVEPDAAVAGPDEQVESCRRRPSRRRTARRRRRRSRISLPAGRQVPFLAERPLLRRALVRHQVDVAADVADEQVEHAVAVPVDGVDRGGRAGDAGLLAFGDLDPLALVDDDASTGLFVLLELGVAGDEDHVAAVLAGRPPPMLIVLPSLSLSLTGAANWPLPCPLKKKSSPGQEPEIRSGMPSPSRSTNCGPKPTHQPVGTRPSWAPSLNLTPAANFGAALVPTLS